MNKGIDSDAFSLLHLNIKSIPAKMTRMQVYMENLHHKFSVLGFSETWLNEHNSDLYTIPGYTNLNLVRTTNKGGGISLYVKECLNFKELPELTVMDYN